MRIASVALIVACLFGGCIGAPGMAAARQLPGAGQPATPPAEADSPKIQAPSQVDVQPEARDSEIQERLQSILDATQWFDSAEVEVRDGVVFLTGATPAEQYKTWATELAGKTQDVAAVVNRIEIRRRSLWDLGPAADELHDVWRNLLLAVPMLLFGMVILVAAWWIARLVTRVSRRILEPRYEAPLLREVLARAAGILVFLLGLYLVLRLSGLTRLAVTVLGGTGLVGLIIGIAFRDITENFLASIFLSMQRPFRTGDLIEIEGVLGYVQRLTIRTTIVMTLDGNHVQLPNSTVYKNVIRNFSSNPNRRESFTVGIGYADTISRAQEVALDVLRDHPAVLKNPEPWVLADSLGSSTVNLKVYFWLNGTEHSWLKVRSSAIRLIKRAFQEHGISMPDEAREIVFPHGVTVKLSRTPRDDGQEPQTREALDGQPSEVTDVSTAGEAGLKAETQTIAGQAQQARLPEEGENLLRSPGNDHGTDGLNR